MKIFKNQRCAEFAGTEKLGLDRRGKREYERGGNFPLPIIHFPHVCIENGTLPGGSVPMF
ncbi:MAG: hypothetical protein ACLTKY_01765 [Oscillospiraceae bacterium]